MQTRGTQTQFKSPAIDQAYLDGARWVVFLQICACAELQIAPNICGGDHSSLEVFHDDEVCRNRSLCACVLYEHTCSECPIFAYRGQTPLEMCHDHEICCYLSRLHGGSISESVDDGFKEVLSMSRDRDVSVRTSLFISWISIVR